MMYENYARCRQIWKNAHYAYVGNSNINIV